MAALSPFFIHKYRLIGEWIEWTEINLGVLADEKPNMISLVNTEIWLNSLHVWSAVVN